jgi:hypothetical protein
VLSHESDKSQKPLFEIGETRQSSFMNWTLIFYWDHRQLGAPSGFNEVSLLQPIDTWMKKMREPQQTKILKWWLIDLIDEKKEIWKN